MIGGWCRDLSRRVGGVRVSSLNEIAGNAQPEHRPLKTLDRLPALPAWIESRFGEFIRYGLASAVALGVDFGTLVFCTEVLGLHYLASAAIGFSLGILVIYRLSTRWVFAHRRLDNRATEWTIFVAIGVAGLVLNQINMAGLTEWGGLRYELSKVVSTGVVFCFNFAARKALLFTLSKRADPNASRGVTPS